MSSHGLQYPLDIEDALDDWDHSAFIAGDVLAAALTACILKRMNLY